MFQNLFSVKSDYECRLYPFFGILFFSKNSLNLTMRNSKLKTKRNLAIPGEPISQEEFVSLIKEAEKGPFHELGDLVEEVKVQWEKNHKLKAKKNQFNPQDFFTKEEFIALVKQGEKGPFTPLGTFEDFRSEILNVWKKKQGK